MKISITTTKPKEAVDVTGQVQDLVNKEGIKDGACLLFVSHTTCCLTTGEVGGGTEQDLLDVAEEIVPKIKFRHAHDPSHAWSHMASSVIGPSLAIPVEEGRLALGTWQSVLLLELDGPRERSVHVNLFAS